MRSSSSTPEIFQRAATLPTRPGPARSAPNSTISPSTAAATRPTRAAPHRRSMSREISACQSSTDWPREKRQL